MSKRCAEAGLYDHVHERDFQGDVVRAAKLLGWRCYWTWTSIHSPAGWPDLFLVKPPRALALELKSMKGTVSPEQTETMELLKACGIETHVFRPNELAAVIAVLED